MSAHRFASSPSIPPDSDPSPVPAAAPSPPPSTSGFRYGWRPADEDCSLEAIDWRSRTALRRADRGLAAWTDLAASVESLTGTIKSWEETLNRHGRILGRLLWAVLVPVIVACVLGAGSLVWRWISTLHH